MNLPSLTAGPDLGLGKSCFQSSFAAAEEVMMTVTFVNKIRLKGQCSKEYSWVHLLEIAEDLSIT